MFVVNLILENLVSIIGAVFSLSVFGIGAMIKIRRSEAKSVLLSTGDPAKDAANNQQAARESFKQRHKPNQKIAKKYSEAIRKLLRKTDSFLEGGPLEAADFAQRPTSNWDRLGRTLFFRWGQYQATQETRDEHWQAQEFSSRSFDRVLGLSVAYPLVLALLFWGLLGDGGQIAESIGLKRSNSTFFNWANLCVWIIAVIFVYRGMRTRLTWVWIISALLIITLSALLFELIFPEENFSTFTSFLTLAVVGAFFITIALITLAPEIGIGSLSMFCVASSAILFAIMPDPNSPQLISLSIISLYFLFGSFIVITIFLLGLRIVIGALVILIIIGAGIFFAIDLEITLPHFNFLSQISIVVVGMIVAAIVGFGSIAIADAARNYHRIGWNAKFVWLIYSIAIFVTLSATGSSDKDLSDYGLMVGLLVLPLINAPFDWLSVNLTRSFLRLGLKTEILTLKSIYSIIDALLAVVILLLLASFAIIAIEAINAFGQTSGLPTALINLESLLMEIDQTPLALSHIWVYFMLFSTLLPTLIHLAIGFAAGIFIFPHQLNLAKIYHKMGGDGEFPENFSLDTVHEIQWLITVRWLLGSILTVVFLVAFVVLIYNVVKLFGDYFLQWLMNLQVKSTIFWKSVF